MDFSRGVAGLADSVAVNRPLRLSARSSLHVNALVPAIQNAREFEQPHQVEPTFDPIESTAWAL